MQDKFDEITKLSDGFCAKHLNDEYGELACYATAALARKRPSPLLKAQAKSWACGIVYALGLVNFLSDRSFEPSMTVAELCKKFGVSKATGYNKSRVVREALDLHQMHPQWTLPGLMEQNPLVKVAEMFAELIPEAMLPGEVRELLNIGKSDTVEMPPQLDDDGRKAKCGICGKIGKLTKTPCCDQWICDDSDEYVLFSYARSSCFRNHDRYTLCSYHFHEGHHGEWTSCEKCQNDFDTEIYVGYGTNEYNFVELENPPDYEPTRCAKCNTVIVLSEGGYSMRGKDYLCAQCSGLDLSKLL